MPKKTKQTSPRSFRAKNDDFFFLVVISVFAALTIFAASYLTTARRQARLDSQKTRPVDLAPVNIAPANPPVYHNPTPKPIKK